MKLLVITQKVDKNDSNLGFFHVWLEKLAVRVDHLYVICLFEGKHTLPRNVTVLSLGKEKGVSKFGYLTNFYHYIFKLRAEYDAVFVHMNPEYVILGGLFWQRWHKKVLLWYTHKAVNMRLRLAEKLATKIFTASKESFRLLSKKVEVVGHGIDTDLFSPAVGSPHDSQRVHFLSVGRISPVKDYETLIRGLKQVNIGKVKQYDIIGEPITKSQDDAYFVSLKKMNDLAKVNFEGRGTLELLLAFMGRVSYFDLPQVYRSHDLLVDASRTGSMDKVVLEALAAGRIVVTSSEAYADLADDELKGVVFKFSPGNSGELAKTIEKIYKSGILVPNQKAIEYVRKNHNLDTLIGKIMAFFSV